MSFLGTGQKDSKDPKGEMMWATLVREGSERRQAFSFPVRDK